ncbi:unnamed protein product [Allacma fusca]|uniref:Tubulin-specific chaperone A n=1 Tax=Allacma fusca TaxID=39272 RepID=A0A8J2LGG2_9HEXA|nr:unnamed protein product [Allacma fusca]
MMIGNRTEGGIQSVQCKSGCHTFRSVKSFTLILLITISEGEFVHLPIPGDKIISCRITLRRYTKEKQSYEKEAADQLKKIEKYQNEGKDELFMRQQTECLKESQLMVPEVQRRLQTAFEELKGIVSEGESNLGETEEYKSAVQILSDAEPHLPKHYAN